MDRFPAPGPDTVRYGGNTSCVQVTLSDGTTRARRGHRDPQPPADLGSSTGHIHILLTHLHLDHIQGLLFFAPLFRPDAEVTIWGPTAPRAVARGPHRALPVGAADAGRDPRAAVPSSTSATARRRVGASGSARIRAEAVTHRGPTLGFRISDGGASLCYIPDHEPALAGAVDALEPEWISGYALAQRAPTCCSTTASTPTTSTRHVGWGHSSLTHALQFARRTEAERTLLFHHDPLHTDDQLDAMLDEARAIWIAGGGADDGIGMATEGLEVTVARGGARLAERSA